MPTETNSIDISTTSEQATADLLTFQGFNPVTGEWNDSLLGDYLWTNTNVGEAMFDVMTPFTWTWLRYALESWQVIPGIHPAGNIGGRAYFNVSAFASMYRVLGMSEQKMLGNIEGTLNMQIPEGMSIPQAQLSRSELMGGIGNALRYLSNQWRYLRDMPAYLVENPGWCQAMQARIRGATGGSELVILWEQDIKHRSREADLRVLFTANHSSSYTMPLLHELVERVGPDEADALLSNLSGVPESLACLGPVVGVALVANGQQSRQAYLEQWGHRGSHEFELSMPRPAEDPTWLDQQLDQFQAVPVDVQALLQGQRAEYQAAWERLRERYPRQAPRLQRRITESARRARLREDARSELARVCWLMRVFAIQAGELTGLGDAVFFLRLEELLGLLSGKDSQAVHYLSDRQRMYERYKALPPYPSIINGSFDPIKWAADPDRRHNLYDAQAPVRTTTDEVCPTLNGSPGAAGRVEGWVRRLDDPSQGGDLRAGEVLVTAQTNIGWTPLFPRAGAIITDIGATLSHAAIVARELGIPAVVGCGDATRRLKTGDYVRVDGGRGQVEILERGDK